MTTEAPDVDAPRRAREGIRVGRILGVPVFLKPSWFVVAIVITVVFARTVPETIGDGATVYSISFCFAVLLLLSVLVHELAHAVAARATGTPPTHIVLDLWGGHTTFETEAAAPWRSVLTAAVGPLSNFALALAFLPVLRQTEPQSVANILLAATVWSNFVVAVFNALPGLPLDGGRVLEAAVWKLTGDRLRGTVVAAWFGRFVALCVGGGTLIAMAGGTFSPLSGIWLLLLAAMLWQGATQSLAAVAWLRRAAVVDPRVLMRRAVAVPTSASVESVLLAASREQVQAVVLLDVYGRPAAVVDERAAGQVPPGRAAEVPASSVAENLVEGAVVDVRLGGEDLVSALQRRPAPRYAVVDGAERVVGVLEWDDVARFVSKGDS